MNTNQLIDKLLAADPTGEKEIRFIICQHNRTYNTGSMCDIRDSRDHDVKLWHGMDTVMVAVDLPGKAVVSNWPKDQ